MIDFYLDVINDQVVNIKTFQVSIGFCVLEKLQKELC